VRWSFKRGGSTVIVNPSYHFYLYKTIRYMYLFKKNQNQKTGRILYVCGLYFILHVTDFHSLLILLLVKFLFEFSHCSIILFYFQGQISNSESTIRWWCICKVVCMTKLFLPANTTLDYIDLCSHAWLKFHLAC